MGRHTLKTGDGEGFLRAAWDMWRDIELDGEFRVEMVVKPTGRKGVFWFRLAAWLNDGPPTAYAKASVTAEYPTAQVQGLEAFLYALTVKLDRVIELQARYPEGKP